MAKRTIRVAGGLSFDYEAASAFSPGMLIELITAGTVQAHSTAGGTAERFFALESEEQGEGVTDAYVDGEIAKTAVFAPGERVNALLANGETAVKGSKLESNGDGYLRVVDADASAGAIAVQSVVGVALEALDMSGSSGADPSSQLLEIRLI